MRFRYWPRNAKYDICPDERGYKVFRVERYRRRKKHAFLARNCWVEALNLELLDTGVTTPGDEVAIEVNASYGPYCYFKDLIFFQDAYWIGVSNWRGTFVNLKEIIVKEAGPSGLRILWDVDIDFLANKCSSHSLFCRCGFWGIDCQFDSTITQLSRRGIGFAEKILEPLKV